MAVLRTRDTTFTIVRFINRIKDGAPDGQTYDAIAHVLYDVSVLIRLHAVLWSRTRPGCTFPAFTFTGARVFNVLQHAPGEGSSSLSGSSLRTSNLLLCAVVQLGNNSSVNFIFTNPSCLPVSSLLLLAHLILPVCSFHISILISRTIFVLLKP
jgi:hypothetical protein